MLRFLRNLFNLKVILAAIVFALAIFGIMMLLLWTAKAKDVAPIPATAILNITAAPTSTPIAQIATPTIAITPTPTQGLPPASGNIAVGDYVQVSGTGGDGLRLHETAGVASEVSFIAIESEVLQVKEGPIEADGYTWWRLQDPYTENASGWGVANYLVVVQNPAAN